MTTGEKYLKNAFVFSALAARDLKAITKALVERQYKAGEVIFWEKDVGNLMYIIRDGLVKIERRERWGKVKTLALLGAGECFGEMAIFGEGIRSATARVLEDSDMLVIDRESFMDVLQRNAQVAFNMIRVLCRRLAAADTQITDIAFKNVNGRVASQLLALSDQYGVEKEGAKTINLTLTHQDIAEMVGTNRESVSRALGAFRREGSIVMRGRKIVVLDVKALAGWM